MKDERNMYVYDADQVDLENLVKDMENIRISLITGAQDEEELLLPAVIQYDARVHGYSRAKLLSATFREPDTISMVATDKEEKSPAAVVGYGCLRTNNIDKAMAGPIYADNDAVAELLIYKMIQSFPVARNNGLLYMTLDSNPGGVRIAEKLGLTLREELPRFFRKENIPKADFGRIYCIHTPNFSLF